MGKNPSIASFAVNVLKDFNFNVVNPDILVLTPVILASFIFSNDIPMINLSLQYCS